MSRHVAVWAHNYRVTGNALVISMPENGKYDLSAGAEDREQKSHS